MSRIDTNFVKQLYSQAGVELTPEKLNHISNNYSSNEELQSAFELKYGSTNISTPEKKNSDVTSVSTSEAPQSESQQPQKKASSLSVGGKPKKTGASASSTGGGKKVGGKEVKKESKSEDLISKFGFKNKEEQKKAGVEASKVKIDAKTPSTVKPVSVKEDEFAKPEIKKAQKEISLFQQKIKREEENAFINNFRNSISIPDNYEQEVRSEIESEISGSGVWNTITQGAKNIWNKVVPYIPGAPSSQSELEQLKSDINFLPEAKKEYKESLIQSGVKLSDISDDMLTKGAIELEVKKRLEDKKLSLANDYLDSLPSDVKNRIKLNTLNKLGINDVELNKKRNYLLATDKEIDGIKNEIATLEEEFQKNGFFSPESQQKYKDLILYVNNKVDERNGIYKKYEKELSEKTTLEEEFDLFKRFYGFEDKTGRLLNSLADFGIGVLQAVNLAKGGPMQDLTATQILGLKLEKDKLANDYLQKQVKETKNINDFIDYSMDVIISQTPNIALGYMTGGTSMMAGIGVSSFGNTYSNLLQSNLEGKTDYSKSQLYFASGLYGVSEALFEKNTLGMIGAGKNLIKKALKNETTKEVVKKSLFNKVVDPVIGLGKDYKGELTEELKTLLGQKITDVVVLDMDSKDVFKNAKEEIISLAKDTGVMTFGLKTFPATFAKILEPFATKEHKDILKSNSEKIDGLSEILNNESSSELAKSEAKNKIDKLVSENDKATEKLIKDISSLDEVLIKEVVDLQSKSEDLKERANNINSDNSVSIEQKKMLLDDLKSDFIRNQEVIYDIVSGQKTSFDILPEEEQTRFKTQAAEAIIKEELDKGVEREKIQEPNPEVINKKAIEIYESNKQTTGQVSEQEKPATTTETETTDTTQQETELQSQEEVSTTPKTETDAVQEQTTSKVPVQSETETSGKVEQGESKTKTEESSEQGKEIFSEIEGKDLSDKTTYDKVYDFLTKIENDLTDIQDNTLTAQGLPISVVKTAIKAMKAAMVAGKVASEVISVGIDALKNTDWYNKKTDVEKANLEPSLANLVIEYSVIDEGKSMAKAEEKKQMALTEKIAERAKTNVIKARLGKLSNNGIFRGRVSKVLSLSTIRPKDAKKILPKDLYDKYVGAIIKLAERGLTIKDTNIPDYEAIYDEIIPYFEEFEDKKATIQEKIYNGEDLTVEEQAFFDKNKKEFFESESKRDESKNEEKEKEIAKNKQELKDLRSKLRDAFKKSNLEKGSKTFEYIDVASMLTDEQIDSMSNAMLKNTIKAFNSFINDDVAPGYFSHIYSNTRTSNVESGISEIDKTAEKTGIYKYKIPKFVADVAQSVESFIVNLASFRVKRLDAKEKMIARIEKYRGTQIDAALKIYRGTPIYDNVIAPIAKKLSFFSSDVEKSLEEMNFIYKSFLKSLKASDDIFTSILRIRYAQLYNMQQSNKGTKSDVPAIEYFKATLKADVYSESENKKISDFIDYLKSKGENYDISDELTKAEQNALNGIRALLDSNTESAYEERVFGNSNASPMIVDYVPVNGKDQMSDTDINDLVKRFEKGSFVSGNLKEKTGTAHSIDLHPFSSAMSSIMSTKLQYHLRTEVLAIKRGINNALNEAKESGNKQKVKLLSAVSEAIDSYVNAIVVGNKVKATAMDKAIDNIATIVSTALLSSETRAAAEFITNTPVLLADGLPMLLEGRKLVSDINELSNGNPDALREFLKTIEASQITSLMDKMKSASEKAGYTKKGVFSNVMSSEIPTSAVKEKAKRFATDNKVSTSFGIYRNFLISGSDNISRFTYFFGKFADEFKKEYGSPIEVDKVLDKNSDYLKDEKVLAAIKKASETANKETTELFGSNNPIERALVSLEASKGIKGKNPITKMLDYAGNYMNQFNRGTISAMRTNINVAIEEKNGRELRKFLLQALRTMGYAPATVAISGLIGYAFYSDDDDEEQLKKSLGKLREDEDLIKEINGYFDFVKNKQEGDKYTEEEEKYRKDLMEKLMKNSEFKKAYDANYSFFNNKLLTQRISAITEKMNEGKSNFGLDSFERIMKIIDGDKEAYGGSVEDFVKSMAYLNSERGMSYYPKEKRLELMEKIEDYFAENNFFDKKSVRKREGALDVLAGYDLLEKLYNYREKGLDDRFLEEGVKMGLNYAIGAKGNLVRGSYETGAEYINRKMIEKKFDHYDYKKDKVFDRPITRFSLDDKVGLSDIPKDLGRAITPAYIQYPTSMKESDIAIAKTLGLPFASSLNRAYNQKQKDEIYKETRGKFQENMLENINETALSADVIRYILDKLEISMTEEEKEEVINIALTPGKGGDKGKTENKGRSSDRLKVGNKKLRGE